jgi:ribose transport system substrate-binding protein
MRGSGYRRALSLGAGLVIATSIAMAMPAMTVAQDEEPVRIGYISGGDADPFVLLVTEGIRAAATEAGVELHACDAAFLDDNALSCARTLAAVDAQSMINWQFNPALAPAVCEAYGNLPTVAIDTPEEPCQATFVGIDNRQAGLIAGNALGEFATERFDCAYDAYISLDIPQIPDINALRAGGTQEGFEAVCGPIPEDKYFSVDVMLGGPDQPENSRRQVADILTTIPEARTILIASPAGDAMPVAVLGAADVAGRKDQVWIVAHGADPSSLDFIRNEPQWVGDVAYFPERYGDLIMPLAIALARGEEVPEQSLVTPEFVNKDNIDEIYPAE